MHKSFECVTKLEQMTNYAFQGVGPLLKSASALAIHLIFVEIFWLKPSLFFVQVPQPKGVGLVICPDFVSHSKHLQGRICEIIRLHVQYEKRHKKNVRHFTVSNVFNFLPPQYFIKKTLEKACFCTQRAIFQRKITDQKQF